MSRKPPALRTAVADLERALAGQPAEGVADSGPAAAPHDTESAETESATTEESPSDH
jgi:hypothetical protein